MTAVGAIDLHLHSTESDGRLSPTELVELAHRNGVRRLVLTDHDTTAGVDAALEAGRRLGVQVAAGIEMSADVPGAEVHVLGLLLDYDQPAFQTTLERLRDGRIGRAMGMVQKLAELGAPISWERVREIAGEASVGRPHVAQALLEAGHVQSMPEAFDRFLGRNAPAYVAREKLTPAECIEIIHSVDGLAVLAHPLEGESERLGSASLARVVAQLGQLAAAGLDGVECYYQSHSAEEVEYLRSLARQHGLIPTGGSDYHGFPMSGMTHVANEPGSVEVPDEVWNELLERKRRRAG